MGDARRTRTCTCGSIEVMDLRREVLVLEDKLAMSRGRHRQRMKGVRRLLALRRLRIENLELRLRESRCTTQHKPSISLLDAGF